MAGVWVFREGVAKLVEDPGKESMEVVVEEMGDMIGGSRRRKVLVFLPENHIISSYEDLEGKLVSLGWRRFHLDEEMDMEMRTVLQNGHGHLTNNNNHNKKNNHNQSTSSSTSSSSLRLLHQLFPDSQFFHFHVSPSSPLLISLPSDFRLFSSVHMYDIVLKNRHHFAVLDIPAP